MTAYPRELSATEVSAGLATLIHGLAARLLAGPTPEHRVLREQLASAQLGRVTLTGVGLYAHFEHPVNTVRVMPPEMIGGQVSMEVRGLAAPGAGSLLKVSEGKIAFVEIYTYGNVAWPDEPDVLSFGESVPIPVLRGST
ncbi:MAG: hypothetical protein ACREMY_13545 [bacterium]